MRSRARLSRRPGGSPQTTPARSAPTRAGATIAGFVGIEALKGTDTQDTLDYTGYGADVTVNFDTGAAEGQFAVVGFDRVVSVGFNDTLVGDQLDEIFEAGRR